MSPEPKATPHWFPHTNMFVSRSGDLVVRVDLSGLQAGDVAVTIENQLLLIRGVRLEREENDSRQMLVKEIPAGPFESFLQVPDEYNLSESRTAYQNGVLRIVIPRKVVPVRQIKPPQRN
jgi:HSP20 family protein